MEEKKKSTIGLWNSKKKDGTTYLSGRLKESITIPAGSYVNIYPNTFKQAGTNAPDYNIQIKEPEENSNKSYTPSNTNATRSYGPSSGLKSPVEDYAPF